MKINLNVLVFIQEIIYLKDGIYVINLGEYYQMSRNSLDSFI